MRRSTPCPHGEGQAMALLEFADYSDADIATDDSQFGIVAGPMERIKVSDGRASGAWVGGGDQGHRRLCHVVRADASRPCLEAEIVA